MKKLLALVALAAVLMTTCSEPIDFLAEVETEVKIANDLFLVVESVISPAENALNANPGSEIIVQFDRDINFSTVSASTIQITSKADPGNPQLLDILNAEFDSSSKRLTLEPSESPDYIGYFRNDTNYTIRIAGIKGADGSELIEDYSWSFHTGTAPTGSISIADAGNTGPVTADSGYTNELTLDIDVASSNLYATQYYVTTDESELLNPGGIVGWESVGNSFSGITLANTADGLQEVYAIFTGIIDTSPSYSKVETKTIYLDRTSPAVNVGDDVISNASSFYRAASVTEAHIKSYQWAKTAGPASTVSFSYPTLYYTYVYEPATDGEYTISLTVADKAGNRTSDSLVYTVDNFGPTITGVSLASGATYSTSTTVALSFSISDNYSDTTDCTYNVYNQDTGWYYGTSSGYRLDVTSTPMNITTTFSNQNYLSRLATVWAFDEAGNFSTQSDSIYIDTVPPGSPNVSGTSPTSDTTPTWSWSSGGNGGVGYYKYKLGSAAWSGETTATSYTPGAALSYGNNTLYVIERDARGNWSSSGSRTIYISSPVIPADGAKGVSTRPFFDWPSTLLATYSLQLYNPTTRVWTDVATGLSDSEYTWPARATALPNDTLITWRYGTTTKGGTNYSSSYSFTTIK